MAFHHNTWTRRHFIASVGVSATVMGAAMTFANTALTTDSSKTLSIVVVGAGLAGLAAINRLKKALPNAKLTLIDENTTHRYQPGYTLLATGVWHSTEKVWDDNASLVPEGVEWIPANAQAFYPDRNQVLTTSNQVIPYDYLVVATGLRLGYEQIEGLTANDLGKNGIGSVYANPEVAMATWTQMQAFCEKGGNALMTLASTDMKCAGAPLKMTFMLYDRLRQAGTLDKSNIDFFSPVKRVFSVPKVNERVLNLWQSFQSAIEVTFDRLLTGVDVASKKAYFIDPQGQRYEQSYDFLHVVPPMFAVESVKNSELANEVGWLDVDKYTLQHKRYPNIFGLGDINGVPKGKTTATVKLSAPVMVSNLLSVIKGEPPTQRSNGYTSCPLLVEEGKAMLVEFDYENNLTPTVPFVDPLQESYFAWFLEEMMLKPAYMAVAKGRV